MLFSFWQKRLLTPAPLRVISRGGARSLLRVCIGSAKQTIDILVELQAQSLLGTWEDLLGICSANQFSNNNKESFLPFDLDAAFSSAVVLLLASTVDPSLLHDRDRSWLHAVHHLLAEMVSRGNLIAKFVASELNQLDEAINMLPLVAINTAADNQTSPNEQELLHQPELVTAQEMTHSTGDRGQSYVSPSDFLGEWNSDDGLSGDQLLALANSLDFEHLDWLDWDFFQVPH